MKKKISPDFYKSAAALGVAVLVLFASGCPLPFTPAGKTGSGIDVPGSAFNPRSPARALQVPAAMHGLWYQIDNIDQAPQTIGTWYFADSSIHIRDTYLSGVARNVMIYDIQSAKSRAVEPWSGPAADPNSAAPFFSYDIIPFSSDLMVVHEYDGKSGALVRGYTLVKETGPSYSANANVYVPDLTVNGAGLASAKVDLVNVDDASEVHSATSDGAGALSFSGIQPGVFYHTVVNGVGGIVIRAAGPGSYFGRIPQPEAGQPLIQPDFVINDPNMLAGGNASPEFVAVSLRNVGSVQAPAGVQLSLSATSDSGAVGISAGTVLTSGTIDPSSWLGPQVPMTNASTPTLYQRVEGTGASINVVAVLPSGDKAWVQVVLTTCASPGVKPYYSYSFDIPVFATTKFDDINGRLSTEFSSATMRAALIMPGYGVHRQVVTGANTAKVTGPVNAAGTWLLVSGAGSVGRAYFQIGRKILPQMITEPTTFYMNMGPSVRSPSGNAGQAMEDQETFVSYVDADTINRYVLPPPISNPTATFPSAPTMVYASQNTRPDVKVVWNQPTAAPDDPGITKYRVWGSDDGANFFVVGETSTLNAFDQPPPGGQINSRRYEVQSFNPNRGWSPFSAIVIGSADAAVPYYLTWSYDPGQDTIASGFQPGVIALSPDSKRLFVGSPANNGSIAIVEMRMNDRSTIPFTMFAHPTSPALDTIFDMVVRPNTGPPGGNSLWISSGDFSQTGANDPRLIIYDIDTTPPTEIANTVFNSLPPDPPLNAPNGLAVLPSGNMIVVDDDRNDTFDVANMRLFTAFGDGSVTSQSLFPVDTSTVLPPAVGFSPGYVKKIAVFSNWLYIADEAIGVHKFDIGSWESSDVVKPIGDFAMGTYFFAVDGSSVKVSTMAVSPSGKIFVAFTGTGLSYTGNGSSGDVYVFNPSSIGGDEYLNFNPRISTPSGNFGMWDASLKTWLGQTEGYTIPRGPLSVPRDIVDMKFDSDGNLWVVTSTVTGGGISSARVIYKFTPRSSFTD